jgi:hypothetical protein
MNYICLSIIYILIIQFFYKLYLKDKINLNLSWLVGNYINNKLDFYLNKIIKLNKQMSIGWIWFGIIIVIFIVSADSYIISKLCLNLNSFVEGYLSFNPDFVYNVFVPRESLKDTLFKLKIVNYITDITLILLVFIVILKFNFKVNIKNIYIWLAISMLILTLAFTAYTFGDLYAHTGSYVKMYLFLRNK